MKIGLLGGGQLGRMIALAAARLGYSCHVLTPDEDSPASQVCAKTFIADYRDEKALAEFAASVDAVTLEFENIPVETIRFLKKLVPVFPDDSVLTIAQDRITEKSFCVQHYVPTTHWRSVTSLDELKKALVELGMPAILKTARFGYDGKGQAKISAEDEAEMAWVTLFPSHPVAGQHAILESVVNFTHEISVIVARAQNGEIKTYPVAENIHRNHILAETHVPARIPVAVQEKADHLARHLAETMNLTGLLCVEMFVDEKGQVLVNELAPRPHNSGHWSIDAAPVSQFEQLVRIVAGLPLGETRNICPVMMTNLIGDEWLQWKELIKDPRNRVHLYGKSESRKGRKMGHVTRLLSSA